MKIEYTEGCVCYGLDVDGIPFNDLKEYKKKPILNKVINAILDDYDIQDVLIDLLRQYGEYKHCFTCEDCGDSVSSYTLFV